MESNERLGFRRTRVFRLVAAGVTRGARMVLSRSLLAITEIAALIARAGPTRDSARGPW
jgi:hypothetical protein